MEKKDHEAFPFKKFHFWIIWSQIWGRKKKCHYFSFELSLNNFLLSPELVKDFSTIRVDTSRLYSFDNPISSSDMLFPAFFTFGVESFNYSIDFFLCYSSKT